MEIPPEVLERYRSPFDDLYGLRLAIASPDQVTATVELGEHHHQIMGITHGGVLSSMIEATCSVGAAIWAGTTGNGVAAMGLSNHTDFLKSASGGVITVTATRVQSGGTLQLWQAEVTTEDGTVLAHGKVRLMNVKAKS